MGAIDQLRDRVAERALDIVERAADLAVAETQDAASRRTGELADGISHTPPVLVGALVMCEIRSAVSYSRAQDEGTGIYGPRATRIFPTTAKALRFDWPAAGGVVFAKSVAGAPGRHFFHEPMPARWRGALATVVG
jgi:hypothetical protein